MKCNNCNRQLPNDSKFCHYCGSKLDEIESIVKKNDAAEIPQTQLPQENSQIDDIINFENKTILRKNNKNTRFVIAIIGIVILAVICVYLINENTSLTKQLKWSYVKI